MNVLTKKQMEEVGGGAGSDPAARAARARVIRAALLAGVSRPVQRQLPNLPKRPAIA